MEQHLLVRRGCSSRRVAVAVAATALTILVVACYPVISQWIIPSVVASGQQFWSTLVLEMGGAPVGNIPTGISAIYDIPLTWVIDYGHLTAYIGGEVYEWDHDSIHFMGYIYCSGAHYFPPAGHQFVEVRFRGDLSEPLDQGDYGVINTRMATLPGETGTAEVGVTILSQRDGGGMWECDPFVYRTVIVAEAILFDDSFESGDTSAWSATVP